jgi:hypothetical protein
MKYLLLFLTACIFVKVQGQSLSREAISGGGGTAIAGNVILTYTIGQPGLVSTHQAGNVILTQGFQQVDQNALGIQPGSAQLKFTLFPNPGSQNFYVQLETPDAGTLTYRAFDGSGKLALRQAGINVPPGSYTVPLSLADLAKGIYLLEFRFKTPRGEQLYYSKFECIR